MTEARASLRELLLRKRGLVFADELEFACELARHDAPAEPTAPTRYLDALEISLAELGFSVSNALHAKLAGLPLAALADFQREAVDALAAEIGAGQQHEPLFRKFPFDVPRDTLELYWKKLLVFYVQAEHEACLQCGQRGTTHVLSPCRHVVCDRCFDGSSYSACPACEAPVDRGSPFFRAAPDVGPPEPVDRARFKRLDLAPAPALEAEARAVFAALCDRKQALSPADKELLLAIVGAFGERALAWLPKGVAVRENVALIFGTLLGGADPKAVFDAAGPYLTTATDVLRVLEVLSGRDGSLGTTMKGVTAPRDAKPARFFGATPAGHTHANPNGEPTVRASVASRRYPVAKLARPLRRAVLAFLDALDRDALVADMVKHRSSWVWLGEFLHPGEFAARFPNVAFAFRVVRGKSPTGEPAPAFTSPAAALEQAVAAGDVARAVALLAPKPGELARRLDHLLRLAGPSADAAAPVLDALASIAPRLATPMLVALKAHVLARAAVAPVRVYFPKGSRGLGVAAPDARPALAPDVIARAHAPLEAELLRRFAAKPAFKDAVIDAELRAVTVPFNERTASPGSVALPRGSRVPVPAGKTVRLFLHWCEPEKEGQQTDLDLSVALYDADWKYVGVCSYYQLRAELGGREVAVSSGDLRAAPWPDGASEFVDLHREAALAAGVRWAVMVVNAYAGMTFDQLERGFAGVMLRDERSGPHFDPRLVELKFAVLGEHGVFIPLVLDVAEGRLHWLDASAKGSVETNHNVETSRKALAHVCPALVKYFGSGARASMFDLATLHAAARARRVFVRRPDGSAIVARLAGEAPASFLRRVRAAAEGPVARTSARPGDDGAPVFAALHRGDLELPAGSQVYALFRERVVAPIAASDLLA